MRKNKLGYYLLCIAVLSFAFLSVGGEYLHNQIHHHADRASHDQCDFYLFQVQLFIALLAIATALILQFKAYVVSISYVLFSPKLFYLPPLRAPPVSL